MNFALLLSPLAQIVLLSLLLLGVVGLARRARQQRLSVNQPVSHVAQVAETVALGGISFAILTMLMVYHGYQGMPYALSDVAPVGAQTIYWMVAAVLAVIMVACLLLAWFRRTVLACIALAIFFCSAGFAVNEGWILGRQGHVETASLESMPIEITLSNQVEGVDVWANGVYLGKTPIHTTAAVFQELPDWSNQEDMAKEWREEKSYYDELGNGARPSVFVGVLDLKKSREEDRNREKTVYFRTEFNGEKMYGNGMSAGGFLALSWSFLCHTNMMQPGRIQLEMFLPRWKKEIAQLLQCARLADYQVDDAWITAAESYNDQVWRAMRHASVNEPEFNQTLDDWARRRYKLDGVHGPDSARDVLEHIATEAEKQKYYSSDSPAGRAVDLVIPYLDVEHVVEQAEQWINAFGSLTPSWAESHGTVDGQEYFAMDARGVGGMNEVFTPNAYKIRPRDAVLIQAVWKLDELLDRKDDSQDNLIEQRLTPAVLRLNPTGHNNNIDAIAEVLGGSVYEQYVLRHNWREQNPTDYFARQHVGGVEVNRWLLAAASMDSEAGRVFRREHASKILEMTERIVQEGHAIGINWPKSGNPISYLFLDSYSDSRDNLSDIGEQVQPAAASTMNSLKPNLAVHFWPVLNRNAGDSHGAGPNEIKIRWAYLCLAKPHCTPEAFVEVYRRYADCRVIQGNLDRSVLITLEPGLRMEVMVALVDEADKLVDQQKPDAQNYSILQANANDFRWLKFLTPTEAAAQEMVDWLSEEAEDKWQRTQQAEQMAERDLFSIFHLRLLAKADDPKLRQLVLTPIQERPTSERRELLKSLLEDEDELVRVKAKRVEHELKTLAEKPLPMRD